MQKDTNIITEALLVDLINTQWEIFDKDELIHVMGIPDYDKIEDRIIVNSKEVRDGVQWGRVDRMNMIRIAVGLFDRGEDLPETLNLSKFNYQVKEVFYVLDRRPEYADVLKIDLDNLKIYESHMLLSMGKDFFFNRIPIEKYRFNYKEYIDIIRAYDYEEKILNRIDINKLKGHNISEILKGESYVKYFDLKKLTPIDWIDLLEERPELLKYCNIDVFMKKDIYYLIQLVVLFYEPDMTNLIFKRDMSEISPLGWEKLLIYNPDRFIDECDFSCLNELNWANIKKFKPDLLVFKL